jgi:hypothetical protein
MGGPKEKEKFMNMKNVLLSIYDRSDSEWSEMGML